MSMCPNIWVQCLKVKLEDKRHNLKIIIFWGHIYYLDIDTKYWTQGVILAQLLFVPKKRIRQMSTYMSVPRAILMTSFFSYIFLSHLHKMWRHTSKHTYLHSLTLFLSRIFICHVLCPFWAILFLYFIIFRNHINKIHVDVKTIILP